MITSDRLANIYDDAWCKRHKKRPLRLLNLLHRRELETRKPGTHFVSGSRDFYQCFKLECTSNIQSTSLTPIRFTPNGQQLISFNVAANEVTVSRYNGVTALQTPLGTNSQKLFAKHFSTQVQGTLCRDLCLVANDSKHMIIAYVLPLNEQNSILTRMAKNNESVTSGFNLEHTTFVTVDLEKGVMCDNHRFEYDSVRIAGGVYLVDRLLGVLSTQHQTITLFKIDQLSGCLSKVAEIGRTLYEDDEFYLNAVKSNPRTENVFNGFRNRLINFMYKKHKRHGKSQDFLYKISSYNLLKMQKMQFLGPDIILIRLGIGATSDSTGNRKDDEKLVCKFVLFDWRRAEIIDVFGRYSETLFKLYVNSTETFQNGHITKNMFPTTMEHCQLLRQQQHENIIDALVASSSPETAVRVRNKTLNVLPCSIGIPLITPFLDAYLFSFDDRLLTCMENGRLAANTELKIFCRKSCTAAISIDISKYTDPESPCRVLFHPHDPLILLSKHYCTDSNIHIFSPAVSSCDDTQECTDDVPGPSSSTS